jgi:hypothetical protein
MSDSLDYDELPELWSTMNGSPRAASQLTNTLHLSVTKLQLTTGL